MGHRSSLLTGIPYSASKTQVSQASYFQIILCFCIFFSHSFCFLQEDTSIIPNFQIIESLSSACIDDPKVIDLIMLWVNGSDFNWYRRMYKLSKIYHKKVDEDYFDQRFAAHDELKFAFRSIEKFAPWIRRIYLITDNQNPVWIKKNHPKLRIINQSDLFYPGFYTFNSNTIQFSLYKLPGVSRRVILMDDDYLFLNHVTPLDFFDESGRTIQNTAGMFNYGRKDYLDSRKYIRTCNPKNLQRVYRTGTKLAQTFLFRRFNVNKRYQPSHNQVPLDMNLYFRMLSESPINEQTVPKSPFRECGDYQMQTLYMGYSLAINESILSDPPKGMVIFHSNQIEKLTNLTTFPKLFCLNEYNATFYDVILPQIFPEKCSFEK